LIGWTYLYPLKNLAVSYYRKYKLKPNDALILATCKHYGIKYLISIDKDFPEPCEKEGIVLINSVEKLKEFLEKENL
jgi:predicted nucleic acid-binding protein